jgi:ubiquinone/menaquinone biosynthesis C-methylase UbiE
MSNRQRKIYQSEGDRYEGLVAYEDYQRNIPRAIDEIINVDGLDIFDLGAGTGRLTLMLAQRVQSIHAFDASAEMLRVCRERLLKSGLSNWQVDVADHRHLPVEDHSADLVVSGWSVAYLAVWYPETYRDELEKWMSEMKRILKQNGKIILLESLTTGSETPVPLEHLKNYYAWLDEAGFENKWIRTDFQFESVEEAAESLGFFFGEDMANRIREKGSEIVPECTGIWWKSL